MISFLLALLCAFLVGLAVASGILLRFRLSGRGGRRGPTLDDAAVRSIIERGILVTDEDEPLDLDQIDEEERRFWSEKWDEPEEW